MNGFPWMQFYPVDWIGDTRTLTLAAKGAWIDILCALHNAPKRGELTMDVDSWARAISTDAEQTGRILRELEKRAVADIVMLSNGDVMVKCRRMLREEHAREQNRQRVGRHRAKTSKASDETEPSRSGNGKSNDNVTDRSQKLEARSQNISDNPSDYPPAPSPSADGSAPDLQGLAIPTPPTPPPAPDSPPAPPDPPPLIVFPTHGEAKEWALTEAKAAEYRQTFPSLDIMAECRKALQWCRDNPSRQKTPRGMPTFLFGWLERAQNSAGGRGNDNRGKAGWL